MFPPVDRYNPALGDAIFKVRIDFAHALSLIWGITVHPKTVEKWCTEPGYRHTPPYISSIPTIQSFDLRKDEPHTVILASDGLRAVLQKKNVPSDPLSIGEAAFALAGLRESSQQNSLEGTLGHSFAFPHQNIAELVIQNAFFGADEKLMAMETDKGLDIYRDDISVVVVQL